MSQISDETLMAFADGVLADAEFDAVADAVERDPETAARLQALVDGARLAQEGYALLLQPVPASLEAGVRGAVARANEKPLWQRLWTGLRLTPSGAAAVAFGVAVIALPAGYTLGQLSGPPAQPAVDIALSEALDTLPTGQQDALPGDLTIVPVATFTDATGNLCREYETSGPAASVSIACRLDGMWQTQLVVATSNEPGYRPASGLAAIDAYLDSIGASPALLDAAEADALRRER